MGLLISRILQRFSGFSEKRILMLGLDAAGKTTLLYKLHLGENITTIPTVGFNVERVQYKSLDLTIWDVGGQDKLRRLWRHYYTNSDALIFVVDCNDVSRLEDAKEALYAILDDDQMNGCQNVLIFANKQDLPNAISPSALADKLGLREHSHFRFRHWYLQACAATSGDGLYEGLDWLNGVLKNHGQPTGGGGGGGSGSIASARFHSQQHTHSQAAAAVVMR